MTEAEKVIASRNINHHNDRKSLKFLLGVAILLHLILSMYMTDTTLDTVTKTHLFPTITL